jgi:hypothetical protein
MIQTPKEKKAEYDKNYRLINREKKHNQDHLYYLDHKDDKCAYDKNYRELHKDKLLNRRKVYYQNNKERKLDWDKKYHATHLEERRNRDLKNTYGISRNDYDAMLTSQGGICKICGATEPGHKRRYFCVDHDHETGRIRGLLCVRCNFMLGHCRDEITILENALSYLRGE